MLADFWALKLTVTDNVINTYNYLQLLTTVWKLVPVFVVKVQTIFWWRDINVLWHAY